MDEYVKDKIYWYLHKYYMQNIKKSIKTRNNEYKEAVTSMLLKKIWYRLSTISY